MGLDHDLSTLYACTWAHCKLSNYQTGSWKCINSHYLFCKENDPISGVAMWLSWDIKPGSTSGPTLSIPQAFPRALALALALTLASGLARPAPLPELWLRVMQSRVPGAWAQLFSHVKCGASVIASRSDLDGAIRPAGPCR